MDITVYVYDGLTIGFGDRPLTEVKASLEGDTLTLTEGIEIPSWASDPFDELRAVDLVPEGNQFVPLRVTTSMGGAQICPPGHTFRVTNMLDKMLLDIWNVTQKHGVELKSGEEIYLRRREDNAVLANHVKMAPHGFSYTDERSEQFGPFQYVLVEDGKLRHVDYHEWERAGIR